MPKQMTIKEYETAQGVAQSEDTGMIDPMTTRGDIIVRNASNVTARLGKGTAGQVLKSDGTDISWSDYQFTLLSDTPSTYSGQANKLLSVKADETGVEFIANTSVSTEFYSDNTGGSTTTAAETDLATLTIPQNDLGSSGSIIITAGVNIMTSTAAVNSNGQFKLYVGGVLKKTITLTLQTNAANFRVGNAQTFTYLMTGVDTSGGDTIVKITGSAAPDDGKITCYCQGLTVIGKQ